MAQNPATDTAAVNSAQSSIYGPSTSSPAPTSTGTTNPSSSSISSVTPASTTDSSNAAREKGWTTPKGYDYEKYTSTLPPLNQPQGDNQEQLPEWAAQAAKYEWKDEFGDVGPRNTELEEMLFRSEYTNRTGLKIGK